MAQVCRKGRDAGDKSAGELLRQLRRGGDKEQFVSLAAHLKGYVYKTRAGLYPCVTTLGKLLLNCDFESIKHRTASSWETKA